MSDVILNEIAVNMYSLLDAKDASEKSCYWHFLILVLLVGYVLYMMMLPVDIKRQYGILLFVGDIVLSIIIGAVGNCRLDMLLAVICILLALIVSPVRERIAEQIKK